MSGDADIEPRVLVTGIWGYDVRGMLGGRPLIGPERKNKI